MTDQDKVELSPLKWEEARFNSLIENWSPAITVEKIDPNQLTHGQKPNNMRWLQKGDKFIIIESKGYATYTTLVCDMEGARDRRACISINTSLSFLSSFGRTTADDIGQYILLITSLQNT